MNRYTRGPVIPDLQTLIFCMEHKDHIYHETTILPACQYFTWTASKLREKVKAGKLFIAETTGKRDQAMKEESWESTVIGLLALISVISFCLYVWGTTP